MTLKPPLAITQGDPSGIGPEIVLQCFLAQPSLCEDAVIFGHWGVLERALAWVDPLQQILLRRITWGPGGLEEALDPGPSGAQGRGGQGSTLRVKVVHLEHRSAPSAGDRLDPSLNHHRTIRGDVAEALQRQSLPEIGRVQALSGEMAAQSIVRATQAALLGQVRAVVTAPIHKAALAQAGWPYPCHTEMLQHECARHLGLNPAQLPVRMMLTHDELTVVLVSIHISLKDAITSLTAQGVLETLQITHQALSSSLGRRPRLALSGLNPHGGEGGLMGREEIDILAPALTLARAAGLDVQGPFSPDTVFMRARRSPGHAGEFDAVVALYHDQGLIPIKYLGLDQGVNVTLGLPVVRTSPDHGTAFDLAGKGQARANSLLAAILVAQAMSFKRGQLATEPGQSIGGS